MGSMGRRRTVETMTIPANSSGGTHDPSAYADPSDRVRMARNTQGIAPSTTDDVTRSALVARPRAM